jgi:hypothetical protein
MSSSQRRPRPVQGSGDGEGDPGEKRAPTPVRDLMPAASPQQAEGEAEPSAVPDKEVEFEVREDRWVARVGGVTRSGTAPDQGAPLLLVTFQPAGEEEPDPRREAWTVASGLDELSIAELRDLFERSRPFRSVDPSGRSRKRRRSR